MNYLVLTEQEMHKILVEFLYAQEKDHYCHMINFQRFNNILSDTDIHPDFRDKITQLRDDTAMRIAEVEKIIEKTVSQLPDKAAIDAAILAMREGR